MKILSFFIFIIIILNSCNIIPFTEKERERLYEYKVDFRKVQFYNADEIILRQALVDTSMSKDQLEVITLPPHTKMICDSIYDDFIKVRFEIGDKKQLLFSSNFLNDSTKNRDSFYRICAYKWDENKGGEILYGGKKFYIIRGSKSRLLFKNNSQLNPKTESRKAKGLKVE